jgi:hypothetical protein
MPSSPIDPAEGEAAHLSSGGGRAPPSSSPYHAGSGCLDIGGCWIRPPTGGISGNSTVNLQFL